MLKRFRTPALATFLAVYLSMLFSFPAAAGLLPSVPSSADMAAKARGEDLAKIQQVLEKQIVTDKLKAYGLSAEEVAEKLATMSDEQLHLMAQASDRVLAGGDGIGFVIGILIIVLLVILIMKLLDKKIIVK